MITIMISTVSTIGTYPMLNTNTIHKKNLVHYVLGLFFVILICMISHLSRTSKLLVLTFTK